MKVRGAMSAQAFADALRERAGFRTTDVTVLNYEPGGKSKKIPGDYLAAVCTAFDVDPEWLLLNRGEMRPVPPEEAQQRLRLIRVAMDADDVSALVELFDRLEP